jgi:hypothetical protein
LQTQKGKNENQKKGNNWTAKMTYSFENTLYGTLGPERVVWDEEANETMKNCMKKNVD